jgi:hypothetical protein
MESLVVTRWIYLKGSFAFWFGAIWAAVGLPFAGVGLYEAAAARELGRDAVRAQAAVVEKGHDQAKDGSSRYWLRYVWRDRDDSERVGLRDVGWEKWRSVEDGQAIEVRYLPDDPARHVVEGEQGPWAKAAIFGVLGVVFGGVGCGLVIHAWRRAGARVNVILTGFAVEGQVTALEQNMNVKINHRHPWFLRVEYRDSHGASHATRSPDLPRRLESRWKPGDPIRVVYDVHAPDRAEIDVFDLHGR